MEVEFKGNGRNDLQYQTPFKKYLNVREGKELKQFLSKKVMFLRYSNAPIHYFLFLRKLHQTRPQTSLLTLIHWTRIILQRTVYQHKGLHTSKKRKKKSNSIACLGKCALITLETFEKPTLRSS